MRKPLPWWLSDCVYVAASAPAARLARRSKEWRRRREANIVVLELALERDVALES